MERRVGVIVGAILLGVVLGIASGSKVDCSECFLIGKVPSNDFKVCQSCGINSTLGISGCDCGCPSGKIISDKDSFGRYLPEKECISCSLPFEKSPSNIYSCDRCPDLIGMEYSSSFVCSCISSSHSIFSSSLCLDSVGINSLTSTYSDSNERHTVTFKGYRESSDTSLGTATSSSLLSKHFELNLMKSSVRCIYEGRNSSCRILSSLCILTPFDSTSVACKIYYSALENSNVGNGRNSLTQSPNNEYILPWIDWEDSTKIVKNVDYSPSLIANFNTILKFKVKIFDLEGNFLETKDLTNELQLCPNDQQTSSSLKWSHLGRNYVLSCFLNLPHFPLLNLTRFYEVYLVDSSSSSSSSTTKEEEILLAVPVHINYEGDSAAIRNENKHIAKRFFLVDNVSGIGTGGILQRIRYAVGTELRITLRSDSLSQTGQIYIPEIFLTFGSRTLSPEDSISPSLAGDSLSLLSPSVSFQTTYTMDLSFFWSGVSVGFIITCILSFLLMCIRVSNYNRRRQLNLWDSFFLAQVIIQGISSLADFLFLFLLALSLYWISVFKGQSEPTLLLPEGAEGTTSFKTLVIIAFIGKIIHVTYQLFAQVRSIIFFIDWERPRGKGEKNKEKEKSSSSEDKKKKKYRK